MTKQQTPLGGRTAEQLFPDEEGWFYTYSPIVKNIGQIVKEVSLGSYQGDTLVLYRSYEDNKWGYLNFGWGSCSGCDALQACGTYSQVQDLMDSLAAETRWFDTPEEALAFFREHDWEGDYFAYSSDAKGFIEECIRLIDSSINF